MLFDLRSRGRRRTVQVIYLGLAVLMLGGLVLFGVGAGSSGGLLNAFNNSGGGNGSQSAAINAQIKSAVKLTKKEPNSPAAWAGLITARYSVAAEGSNYDQTTGSYTASGKKELSLTAAPWSRYLQLTHDKPNVSVANTMALTYGALAQYNNEASAWEYVADAEPGDAQPYVCLAASAFAAKQDYKANLAEQKALALTPKLKRLELQQEMTSAKTDPSVAQQC